MSKYKGELEGFPDEVVDKMCYYQVQQRTPKDVSVFEKRVSAYKDEGGFNWYDTPEGKGFWSKVIGKDFDLFFERYPKIESGPSMGWKPYPKEKVMEVSRNNIDWYRRVVFGEKNKQFMAWGDAETTEEAKDYHYIFCWDYAREVTPTLDEVLETLDKEKDVVVICSKDVAKKLDPDFWRHLGKTKVFKDVPKNDIELHLSDISTKDKPF